MKLKSYHKNVEKRKMMHLPLGAYLSYLLIATLLFTGVTFSKFSTTQAIYDTIGVTAFSVSIEGDDTNALELDFSDATTFQTDSYSFTVMSNSEVAVADMVTVNLPDDLPDGIIMSMTVNSVELPPVVSGNTYTYTETFAPGNHTHTWSLTFSGDPNTMGSSTESIILSNIAIHVEAIQID